LTRITGILHDGLHKFMISHWILLGLRKVFDKIVEKIKTKSMSDTLYQKNCAFMWRKLKLSDIRLYKQVIIMSQTKGLTSVCRLINLYHYMRPYADLWKVLVNGLTCQMLVSVLKFKCPSKVRKIPANTKCTLALISVWSLKHRRRFWWRMPFSVLSIYRFNDLDVIIYLENAV
jgi:hypothetical protein